MSIVRIAVRRWTEGKKMLIKLFLFLMCAAFGIIALAGASYIAIECLDLIRDIVEGWNK